ncbi:MAG TPA: histone deacetylase [Candidatus Saccharimonadales bacterium]|nr:histone deacetylase [Candidatus Saccharimonadales bacterium]
MKVITDERCIAYSSPGHPERPARISKTLERLREQKELSITWTAPMPVEDEVILRAHTREHVDHIRNATEHFDGDTPAHPHIYEHAQRSVGGAIQAMRLARQGEMAFSLLRPPGHHATRNQAMGFCYLNSIAIAALEALASGCSTVAIYDFDVHHGNGTEAILVTEPHTFFASIHQHPCYPGTGKTNAGSNCFNFPVAPQFPRAEYRKTLTKALDALLIHKPDLIGVSAGFDAYAHDPLAQETLEAEDFHWIGASLRELGIPVFSVLEGGYSNELPELILAYLKGLDGK